MYHISYSVWTRWTNRMFPFSFRSLLRCWTNIETKTTEHFYVRMLCRALWFIFHTALWLCLFMALINLSYLSYPSIYLPVSWRLNYSNEARCSEAATGIWFKHLLTSVAPVYLRLCPPTLCNDVLSTSWKGDGSTRISSISIGLSISFSSHAVICNSE